MNAFLDVIINLSDFILSFVIISIIVYFIFKANVSKINFNSKMHLFGIFLELNNWQILALAAITIKYIYTIYVIISLEVVDYVFFFLYLILTLIYLLASKNIRMLLFEVLNCFFIYYLFKVIMLVYSYMLEVRFEWYLGFIVTIAIIFMALYCSYFTLRNINNIVTRNKYITKEEVANVVKKI